MSAMHPSCSYSAGTIISDYFGIDSAGGSTYVTSVSTFNCAAVNPFFHQQQVVARIAMPQ